MSQDCITILSSDNDEIQVIECVNAPSKSENVNMNLVKDECTNPSARRINPTPITDGKSIFNEFLEQCKKADKSSEMDKIVTKLWKHFNHADPNYTNSYSFIDLIKKSTEKVLIGPLYCQIKYVSDELKYHKLVVKNENSLDNAFPSTSGACSNVAKTVDHKTAKHIEKLEKALVKLHKKIQYLENQEVDLNSSDEDDSAYIQVSRYKERVCQIFKKICELQSKDSSAERILKKNIRFSGTNYPVLNRTIEKFYNDRRQFPDYHDVLNLVKKVNIAKNLNLVPHEIDQTALVSFRELGKILKQCRQYDFYDTFGMYEPVNKTDPADNDDELKTKLEDHRKHYGNKIDEIIDKYAAKQTEDNVKADEVKSDANSESDDSGEESKEEDRVWDSDIEETVFKYDQVNVLESDRETEGDIFNSCTVVLPNIIYLPIWETYKQTDQFRHLFVDNIENIVITPGIENNVDESINNLIDTDIDFDSYSSSRKRKHQGSDSDSDSDSSSRKRKHQESDTDSDRKKTKYSPNVVISTDDETNITAVVENQSPIYSANKQTDHAANTIENSCESGLQNELGNDRCKLRECLTLDLVHDGNDKPSPDDVANENTEDIADEEEIVEKSNAKKETEESKTVEETSDENKEIDEPVEEKSNNNVSQKQNETSLSVCTEKGSSNENDEVMIIEDERSSKTQPQHDVNADEKQVEIIDVEKLAESPTKTVKPRNTATLTINLSQFIRSMNFNTARIPNPTPSKIMNHGINAPPVSMNNVSKENGRNIVQLFNKNSFAMNSTVRNSNQKLIMKPFQNSPSVTLNALRRKQPPFNNRPTFATGSLGFTPRHSSVGRNTSHPNHVHTSRNPPQQYMQAAAMQRRQVATSSHKFVRNSGTVIATKRTTVIEEQQIFKFGTSQNIAQNASNSVPQNSGNRFASRQPAQKNIDRTGVEEIITLD